MSEFRAIRGMNDILPEQTPCWRWIETTVQALLASYGYGEIRLPVVEKTALFKRSIGEVTDIVEKEMYSFDDRNGESMTLRPEGTAGCVRAAVQQGLLGATRRLWYAGPMFRYERPQKGRQRQFHQVGAEAFGVATPDIDAELILMSARLWRELGIAADVSLQLNSIGSVQARANYRTALVEYLSDHRDDLDEDSLRRLDSNPLRILDSKNVATQGLLDGAPSMAHYLDEESAQDFARLRELLDAAGVAYEVNTRLVRGLDYYNKTVFEWVTERLGAQGTICAGGRYDSLVAQLGGKPTPAVGFALGLERLVLMLQESDTAPAAPAPDIYVVAVGPEAEIAAWSASEALRDGDSALRVMHNTGGGSFKSQMKRADKSGAELALIWGEDEITAGSVTVKALRAEQGAQQQTVAQAKLADTVSSLLRA